MQRAITKKIGSMTIIITEDTYDKALTAFNFGVAGVEMGMKVQIFFTSRGINIMKKSYKPRRARWGEAPVAWKESSIKRNGGVVLAELMYQARDMGVPKCAFTQALVFIVQRIGDSHLIMDGLKQ